MTTDARRSRPGSWRGRARGGGSSNASSKRAAAERGEGLRVSASGRPRRSPRRRRLILRFRCSVGGRRRGPAREATQSRDRRPAPPGGGVTSGTVRRSCARRAGRRRRRVRKRRCPPRSRRGRGVRRNARRRPRIPSSDRRLQATVDQQLGAAVDQAEARPVDDVDVDAPGLAAAAPPVERRRQLRSGLGGGATSTSEAAIGVSRLAG